MRKDYNKIPFTEEERQFITETYPMVDIDDLNMPVRGLALYSSFDLLSQDVEYDSEYNDFEDKDNPSRCKELCKSIVEKIKQFEENNRTIIILDEDKIVDYFRNNIGNEISTYNLVNELEACYLNIDSFDIQENFDMDKMVHKIAIDNGFYLCSMRNWDRVLGLPWNMRFTIKELTIDKSKLLEYLDNRIGGTTNLLYLAVTFQTSLNLDENIETEQLLEIVDMVYEIMRFNNYDLSECGFSKSFYEINIDKMFEVKKIKNE